MKKLLLIILLSSALIFSGCSDNAGGILYEIEKEEPIDDGVLNNELSLTSLVDDGSSFYIASGRVYSKSYTASDWSPTVQPGKGNTLKIALYSGTLIALLVDTDNNTRLYTSNTGGASWTLADVTVFSATESAANLIQADGEVFIISADTDTGYEDVTAIHTVYRVTAVSPLSSITCSEVTLTDGSNSYNGMNKVLDIAIDGSSQIWAITGAEVLTDGLTVGSGLPTEIKYPGYTGIHYSTLSDHTGLYLAVLTASGNGSVYIFNGTSWILEQEGLRSTKDFGDITVYDSEDTPYSALTLGTGSGYLENVGAAGTFVNPDVTATDNYYNYDLSIAPVHRLISLDTGTPSRPFHTFALTSTFGLWINKSLSWELE